MNSNRCSSDNLENEFLSCLFSLPPKQFALLSSLIGIFLIDNLDTNQLNSLGNFIINVGQVILTAAAQSETLDEIKNGNNR
jgi:hypothetical protein